MTMKEIKQLSKEINELTLLIEEKYPELYQYLGESPLTIPSNGGRDISSESFAEYLNTLKLLLQHHIDKHQGKE
jgi:hypothetical protein